MVVIVVLQAAQFTYLSTTTTKYAAPIKGKGARIYSLADAWATNAVFYRNP